MPKIKTERSKALIDEVNAKIKEKSEAGCALLSLAK